MLLNAHIEQCLQCLCVAAAAAAAAVKIHTANVNCVAYALSCLSTFVRSFCTPDNAAMYTQQSSPNTDSHV
eukprot:18338-Heterococcus_DN1.PRE.2